MRTAAERYGDRAAVVDGDEVVSFARLAHEMTRVTRALVAAGVARGDRVGIWAPNGWRWIVAALATHAAGAAVVPVNTRYKGEEAAYVLGRSGARVLFTVRGFLGTDYVAMLHGAGEALRALERVVVMAGAGA
ncbi:MAG TPA: AMP-binding protein, partial [Polyangiaceae bacterium]